MSRAVFPGAWPSPFPAARVSESSISISEPRFDGDQLFWIEGRPAEGGRAALVGRRRDGSVCEQLGPERDVRSAVHEMGGGAWARRRGVLFFVEAGDQRLYRAEREAAPIPLTPEPAQRGALRYADIEVSPDGRFLVSVREFHMREGEPVNEIVRVASDGSGDVRSLVRGHDFFSFPRISPDGARLLWTTWDHPRMPWDGTDLWTARMRPDGSSGPARHLAGGTGECIFQPAWTPAGEICFVSDRTGWGNLYRLDPDGGGDAVPLCPMEAEVALPQWVFGLSRYALLGDGRIVFASTRDGSDSLIVLDPRTGRGEPWDVGYSSIAAVRGDGRDTVAVVGGSGTRAWELAVGRPGSALSVVGSTLAAPLEEEYLSEPRHVEVPAEGGSAYAFVYPPVHPHFRMEAGESPPLVVTCHGGPTGAASPVLDLAVQFWTSRGFALADVDYRGSTGYGRAYMERLRGEWGRLDVADAVAAARYLGDRREVDPRRMFIRGKSAGGLTVLGALVFHDLFRAGACYYAVADPESLAGDTHKFESRYLETLIGPWPEKKDVYRSRSPLAHAERLRTPVIFFQGLEDPIVPPSQTEAFVRVLRERKLPHAYLTFEGERHGFRQSASIRRALEAELSFYLGTESNFYNS